MSSPPTPTASPEPLLVAAPVSWRDACFSLPAVRSIRAAGTPVVILCPESQRAFWEGVGMGEPITYPDGASARGISGLVGDTARALLWEPGAAADGCAKAGVAERIGLPAPKLVKRLTRQLERTITPGPSEHRVAGFLDVARLLDADPMRPEHFAAVGSEHDRDALLVVADSDFPPNHEWPAERWEDLVRRIGGERTVVIGKLRGDGPSARLAARTECESVEIDLADPASYRGFARLVGADGSLPHLAGAFGTTCAVLFGPGDPELVRPLGRQHTVIRRKVECSPCFLAKCPIDLRCQNDLTADRIADRLGPLSPA